MRGIVLAVLAATGCNAIFGLDHEVHGWDAAPPKLDAPPVATTSTFLEEGIMRADYRMQPGCTATPPDDGTIAIEPYGTDTVRSTALPSIQIGSLFAADGVTLGALTLAPYEVSDGSFAVPTSIVTTPWRVVYTLPGDPIPHEVQWALDASHHGKLLVPSTTRLDAPNVPPNSSYSITPTGAPAIAFPVVLTTGVFTSGPATSSGTTVNYSFANAVPLYGPPGAPEKEQCDVVVVMRSHAYIHDASDPKEASIDGWAATSLDLTAGSATMPATPPAWQSTPTMTPGVQFNTLVNNMRLQTALGAHYDANGVRYRWVYGFSPNLGIYGFGEPAAPDYVERPLVLPIDTLPPSAMPVTQMTFVDIDGSVPLPRVWYAATTDTRTLQTPAQGHACPAGIAGLTLTSGYAALLQVSSDHGAELSVGSYPAPLARNTMFGGHDLGADDCSTTVPPTTTAIPLTWATETAAGVQGADDYEVVLFQITPGSPPTLQPLRTYRVVSPSVQVDGGLLASGSYYAFEIISHWGLPNAAKGDYTAVRMPPFGSSSEFAGVFKVQ